MKKLICLLLATMMLATIFVGCSNNEGTETESPSQDVMETTAEPTEEPTEEPEEEFEEDPEEDFTEGPEEDPTEKPNATLSPIDAPIWLDSTDELEEFIEQFHINDGVHDEELDYHFSMTLLLPKGVTTKTEYDDSQFPYLIYWDTDFNNKTNGMFRYIWLGDECIGAMAVQYCEHDMDVEAAMQAGGLNSFFYELKLLNAAPTIYPGDVYELESEE